MQSLTLPAPRGTGIIKIQKAGRRPTSMSQGYCMCEGVLRAGHAPRSANFQTGCATSAPLQDGLTS